MKALLVTLEYAPSVGGVAIYLKHLAAEFEPREIIILAPPAQKKLPFSDSVSGAGTIYRRRLIGPRWLWPRWLPLFWQMLLVILKERPTRIIVSHILPVGTAAFFFKKIFKLPYIVICHGMDLAQAKLSAKKTALCGVIFKNADFIVGNSNFTKNLIESFGVSPRDAVTAYPCSVFEAEPFGDKPREPIILSVGRLVKRKGFDTVLKSFTLTRRQIKNNNLRLVIIGDGPERDNLIQLTKNLGIADAVDFFGQVSDEKLMDWYRRASLFALLPRELSGDVEGFGTVFLDAATFGLPSVGTKSGGVPEAIIDGETGLLVEPDDIKGAADAFVKLFTDDVFRARLGAQARQRVLSEFTPTKQMGKIVARLKSL